MVETGHARSPTIHRTLRRAPSIDLSTMLWQDQSEVSRIVTLVPSIMSDFSPRPSHAAMDTAG
jgi:hypothetical protein